MKVTDEPASADCADPGRCDIHGHEDPAPEDTRCASSLHIPTTGAACSVCGAPGMQHEDDHPGSKRRG